MQECRYAGLQKYQNKKIADQESVQECKLRGSQNARMQIRRNAPYTKSELQKVQNGKSAKSANWQIARVQECKSARVQECKSA